MSAEYWPVKRPTFIGAVVTTPPAESTSGSRNSFHDQTKTSTASVSVAGFAAGRSTRRRMRNSEVPSIRAASSSERGTARKNARIQNTPKGK